MPELEKELKKYYGYDTFRAGQREVIDTILNGRDVLAIMPTGSGKSVCYQLPALLLGGITIVVSPLISLMKDQVAALGEIGVRAAYINSSLTPNQTLLALKNASRGMYKIIYVAPERLETDSFRQFSHRADISLVAIDEAHCVSQWGHDFRRSYLNVSNYIATLPKRPVVAAFTATATERVRRDISDLLCLHDPKCVTTGYDRPNLYFGVDNPKDKFSYVLDFIRRRRGKSGIIYCSTRKQTDLLCGALRDRGIEACKYHAGLTDAERGKNQEDFVYDRATVIVATNAFGMGIDKSNVSFVIHYNMPLSVESYYQEAGRAGRDGANAECVLLYSKADIAVGKFMLDRSFDALKEEFPEEAEASLEVNRQKFDDAIKLFGSKSCLRARILDYFGEAYQNKTCGKCSVCLKKNTALTPNSVKLTVGALVKATGGRFGASMIASILSGEKNERIIERGFDKLYEFGSLRLSGKSKIRDMIDSMIAEGSLEVCGSQYPVLKLSHEFEKTLAAAGAVRTVATAPLVPNTLKADVKTVEKLKCWRKKAADIAGVPPYIIMSDLTIDRIAVSRPRNIIELSRIDGMSDERIKRYGKNILSALAKD